MLLAKLGRALLLALVLVPSAARASDLPPWRDADDLPISEGASSALASRDETAILSAPSATAERRGTATTGVRLPLFGAKRGPGCAGRWLAVGPWAWICQDAAQIDVAPPIPAAAASLRPLPYQYYFVGRDGSSGYARLEDAEDVAPDRELEPGFAVAIVELAAKGSERYGRTHHGLWVPMRDLIPTAPVSFEGEEVKDGKLDFAWTFDDRTAVFPSPPTKGAAPRKGAATLPRFTMVAILEKLPQVAPTSYRIGDGQWVRARDVRAPTPSPRPSSLRPGERWIDVELATQTLVAYEDEVPFFATLVSTGKGREGTDTATPKGEFRIWVKLESSNMDNLEDEEAERYYAIEDVPHVQYFAKGVGLHGVFWHRGFGRVRSHGCVNLAPRDAARLFAWTSPRLPAGWSAVLPTPHEQGTIVRVR
jgi:lipoprotein-anchoring transpeptidase ErfK/SrfK